MNAREALAAIARGERTEALLGNCRCEWSGGEAYGEEAIAQLFRTHPLELDDGVFVGGDIAAAWFGGGDALFADLYDGRVGRLWRIGPGAGASIEPSIGVALDPDLRQARGEVFFRAEDHPALDPAAADAVIAAGAALMRDDDMSPVRARAFAIRAFGTADHGAALFALYRLGGDEVRTSGFAYAAAMLGAEQAFAIDQPLARAWTPRL